MLKIITAFAMFALLAVAPVRQAAAQNNTLGGAIVGGGIGAIIGGAATGKAGGAIAGGIIGAAAGAAIGSQFEPRGGSYYWYRGHCWRRWHDGSYHRVRPYHCDY